MAQRTDERWQDRERDALVTEPELAERWRVSTRTAQRWRQAGTGPAYIRLGARVYYRWCDILAYEEAARHAGGPEE